MAKVLKFLFLWIFQLIYPLKVIHKERLRTSGPLVVVCNHLTFIDPILLFSLYKDPINFVGKKELVKNKFLAWFFKSVNVIPIDRGNSDLDAIKTVIKRLKASKIIGIFPEGTRSASGELGGMHTGAAMLALKGKADIQVLVYKKKLKAFTNNYLLVGHTINISDYRDLKANHALLARITEAVEDEMRSLLAENI